MMMRGFHSPATMRCAIESRTCRYSGMARCGCWTYRGLGGRAAGSALFYKHLSPISIVELRRFSKR